MIGLKDLEVLHEGASNPNHKIKALFLGLMRQRTHQALADEKGLILVEMRAENDFYPRVVAEPREEAGRVRSKEDLDPNEVLDFELVSLLESSV